MAPTGPVSKRSLNLAERIAVIELFEKTPNKNHIARAFDCGRAQITNILRHKDDYLADWQKHKDPTRIRRGRSTELAFLGMVVREWIKRCRYFGVMVTDDLIKNIGTRVSQLTHYTEFRATNRWLDRFKSKYRLSEADLLQPVPNQSDKGNLTEKSLVLEQIIADLRGCDVKSYDKVITQANKSTGAEEYESVLQQFRPSDSEDSNFVNGETQNEVCMVELVSGGETDNSMSNDTGYGHSQNYGEQQQFHMEATDEYAKEIDSYKQALNHLGPLEQFLLMQEDIRSIGLLNQLENIFREKMLNSK